VRSRFPILFCDHFVGGFRSRRSLVLAGTYLLGFLLVSSVVIKLHRVAGIPVGEALDLSERGAPIAGFLRSLAADEGSSGVVEFVLSTPAINLSLAVISLALLPLLIVVFRHDIPSREMEAGTLRFLVWRVKRFPLLLSRFLGGVAEIAVVTLGSFLLVLVYALIEIPGIPVFKVLASASVLWVRLLPYTAAAVALALFFSVLAARSRRALLYCCLGFFLLLFGTVFEAGAYLSPFSGRNLARLFASAGSWPMWRSVLFYCGFAAAVYAAAQARFSRKDL